jgi:biogenesis of lysosome-related organelles complex 1 subunit 4
MAANDNLPKIISFKPDFDQLCLRIDDLERFVDVVDNNLDCVEKQIQIAEEELDIPDKAFNVFLKSINIFGKPKSNVKETNLNNEGFYEPAAIFKTGDHFPKETELVKNK